MSPYTYRYPIIMASQEKGSSEKKSLKTRQSGKIMG
jgi:hypothetical protein